MVDVFFPILGLFAAVSGLGGIALRFAFARERRIKRALARPAHGDPRRRDGKAVKLVGELVYAGHSIPAPLSQRACAYYSIVVEQVPRSRHARRPLAHHRHARNIGIDFYLRDDTGVALVRIPAGNEQSAFPRSCAIARRAPRPSCSNDADLERFLTGRGISVEGAFFRKNLRAYEGILEAGERVAVGGLARWMPDPDAAGGNYRETPKRLVLEASESLPLFLSDDPATTL